MASNLALVSQCAVVGVPRVYPRHRVRTNMVTKSNHMTAKPLVRCEAEFPVSGNPIRSDSAAKRGDQIKMMAVSSPSPTTTEMEEMEVHIRYTQVELSNDTFQNLDFYDKNYPSGDGEPLREIVARYREGFRHDANPDTNESIGGVAYTIAGNLKWIVAWACLRDAHPKVYTEFTTESDIGWDDIFKKKMRKFNPNCPIYCHKYKSRVYIETSNPETPRVNGILKEVDF